MFLAVTGLRPRSHRVFASLRETNWALSEDGNPTLDTVLKVLKALVLQMRIEESGRGRLLELGIVSRELSLEPKNSAGTHFGSW